MNDRQKEIIEAATDQLLPFMQGRTREELGELLYNLVIDCRQPPRTPPPAALRRQPLAGEVLPRHQRASWAQAWTEHDAS